jgi:acetyl coenzyme A synthetase (ADP forming)-like protein
LPDARHSGEGPGPGLAAGPGPADPSGVVDVILRDGATLRMEPPHDADEVARFFANLSDRSLYLRFHGAPSLKPERLQIFVDPDWAERGGLAARIATGDEERMIALASYARLRDPRSAEVAFAVADEHQGRGIGTRLLEQLAARAAEAGIERFVAEVLPENRAMIGVFEEAGFAVARELAGGVVEVSFPIRPTEQYVARVDERDHLAVVASLRPFFAPASVAVVGASTRPEAIGNIVFRNVLAAGFTGAAHPVNRNGEPVSGMRGYRALAELPEVVDLAVICVPAAHVLHAAHEALDRGTRALCVISAGFAETGPEGRARQDELLAAVRAHGARLVGPNCLGIAVSTPRLNATFGPRALPPGPIALSSQSGALGLALLEKAEERNLGLSAFVSIGNKADVSSNDLLEYWEDDPDTKLVLLYLESFGNPRRFGRIARRVSRKKPILAMKSGTTRAGAKAAGSHTAALAGSEAAVDALFHQAGVLRAGTLGELLDAASLLARQPLPRGKRVGILTNAGGLGILAADACEAEGLELPALSEQTVAELVRVLPGEASLANPVDMLGSATAATYEAVLPHLLADPGLDALIILFVPPATAGAEEVAEAVRRAVEAAGDVDKPVLTSMLSAGPPPSVLTEAPGRLVNFSYPESAARALGVAAARAAWLRRPAGATPDLDGLDEGRARKVVAAALAGTDDAWLTPTRTRELLESYGIALVPERVAADEDSAVAAAAELGYPAVVKTATAGAHKTESGGVALRLADEEAVRHAVRRIGPPVIVQPMAAAGAELLAGVTQDPTFGPLVAFGPGGVLAELIGEATFRIAPLTDADVEELLDDGKAGKLIAGYRGALPADRGALADLLHRLSRLGDDLHEVAELDLNPVVAGPEGCLAVDARVRVTRAQPQARAKTW